MTDFNDQSPLKHDSNLNMRALEIAVINGK